MSARILVVDDSRGVRDALQLVLELEGYDVRTAIDGRHALDQIASARPDVIVTDLQMPVMTGTELADRLRVLGLDIPVVFITAGAGAGAEAERHRAAAWLEKPFSPGDLLAVLTHLAPAA